MNFSVFCNYYIGNVDILRADGLYEEQPEFSSVWKKRDIWDGRPSTPWSSIIKTGQYFKAEIFTVGCSSYRSSALKILALPIVITKNWKIHSKDKF